MLRDWLGNETQHNELWIDQNDRLLKMHSITEIDKIFWFFCLFDFGKR